MKTYSCVPTSILIVGGGFGGVSAAKALAKKNLPDVSIRLVDPKSYFEYHAALYRFVTGRSPMEVCIPYRDIFAGTPVDIVTDRIESIDLAAKKASGSSGSEYRYDYLILAIGCETSYFGIPGIQELAYGLKSANEAVRLKNHISDVFRNAPGALPDDKNPLLHLVIVGGGASGVELAGELGGYTANIAKKSGVDPSLVTIDIIEGSSRLLPQLSASVSEKVEKRLRTLGVNIFLNRLVQKEDVRQVYLKDMQMKTKTVVWTAGTGGCSLLKSIAGLSTDKRCRIEVDEQLRAHGHKDVFVLGDAAATKYSGMAQTALRDGAFAANVIEADIQNRSLPVYEPVAPEYAVPVGPKWAAVSVGRMQFFGRIGWILRRSADFKVFLALLPLRKAIAAFRAGHTTIGD